MLEAGAVAVFIGEDIGEAVPNEAPDFDGREISRIFPALNR